VKDENAKVTLKSTDVILLQPYIPPRVKLAYVVVRPNLQQKSTSGILVSYSNQTILHLYAVIIMDLIQLMPISRLHTLNSVNGGQGLVVNVL